MILHAERMQAETERLEAENARLLAGSSRRDAAKAPCSRAESPSPSTVRDKPSRSTRDSERFASHKEASGKQADGGAALKHSDRDKDSAEKAIAGGWIFML